MDMRTKTAIWGVVIVIGIIMLVLLAHDPIHPPRARAQHITAVNSVRTVTFTMMNTNALANVPR